MMEVDNLEQKDPFQIETVDEFNLMQKQSEYIVLYGDFKTCFWTKKAVEVLDNAKQVYYKIDYLSEAGKLNEINVWPIIRKMKKDIVIYEIIGYPESLEVLKFLK